MGHRLARITAGLLTAFIALTAIPGGIAMLAGLEDFPLEWLAGTPFRSYTIPALLLSVVVGGSALVAAVMVFARREGSAIAAMAAGAIMAGYITIEVLILDQGLSGPSAIEVLYFVVGALTFALSAYLWRAGPAARQKAA